MLDRIAYCKIHPAIGIARVGNSPEAYFIGPEVPDVFVAPSGGYKDAGDPASGIPPRVKRQAARFRLYGYDEAGTVLGEVMLGEAEISWTVHLVNSKAEGDRFAGKAGEDLPLDQRRPREAWRNADVEDRASLVIDPGPRTVAGPNKYARFDGGRFRGAAVLLGDLKTDAEGRLLVLGGFGLSKPSNPGQRISNYANNDRWHDDVSDGPVTATVTLKSGHSVDVRPAWVIVAPPDFAPSVTNGTTLYDVASDVALRHDLAPVPDPPGDRPSFRRHIAPIFERLAALAWVQQDARGAGKAVADFTDLSALALAGVDRRRAIFARFRDPTLPPESDEAKRQATADFLPALSGDSGDANPGDPERWLCVTQTQYSVLGKWRAGSFENDWSSPTTPKHDVTPHGLDRAALESCAGGAFYPGIEGGWLLRNPQVYAEPYRLSHKHLKPGDVTRRMACPWQADFYECRWHWWPAQRPDEVLTLDAYRRLQEIEAALDNLDRESAAGKQLETEQTKLFRERTSWTRGLPTESYDGDLAMIERWAEHGFVVTAVDKADDGLRIPGGNSIRVETGRGRYDGLSWPEYFHILTNIEQHPDFLPKAKEIAHWFFAHANYDSDEKYQTFVYSPEAFDARMKAIYDGFVDAMNDRSRMDTGLIQWPVIVRREGDREITKLIEFNVGPFSNKVVKERLRQRAPFNLVDGAWLQRIQSAGPIDETRAHLFAIWDDEAGNGRTEQNHCNVYDTLLRSLNIYMPPITARQFTEQDLLPSAFIQPVFELVVSLFPDEFFPELLGMTLYLEWEATPTLTPNVYHYRGRGIDPHFYALHVAIDNITAGHGFLAKEAIKLYLQGVEDEGGTSDVEEAWRRIWSGYVTWATAGNLGMDLLELCLKIDYKRIDLSYPAMLLAEHILNPSALVSRLAKAASDEADQLATYLTARFRPEVQEQLRHLAEDAAPPRTLIQACVDELNRLVQERESFFAPNRIPQTMLGDDTKALLSRSVSGEELVQLNRLLLRDGFKAVIDGLPKLEPRWFPDYRTYHQRRLVDLIRRKAYAAKPLHRGVIIGDNNLAELFDDPERLVEVLATSDLINVEHPRSSRIFEAMSFSGPMYKIFTEDEQTIILDWIEALRTPGEPSKPTTGPSPQEAAAKVLAIITHNATSASHVQRHAQYEVDGRPLKAWFSDPPGLMAAFARSRDWVVPGDANASRLYAEFSTGPMSFMSVADDIRRWIDLGAVLVEAAPVVPAPAPPVASTVSAPTLLFRQHFATFSPAPDTVAPASVAVAPHVRPAQREFAAKRKLIGMGAVH